MGTKITMMMITLTMMTMSSNGFLYKRTRRLTRSSWNAIKKTTPLSNPTIIDCGGFCAANEKTCNAFLYNKETQTCELGKMTHLDDVDQESAMNIHVDVEWMDHICKGGELCCTDTSFSTCKIEEGNCDVYTDCQEGAKCGEGPCGRLKEMIIPTELSARLKGFWSFVDPKIGHLDLSGNGNHAAITNRDYAIQFYQWDMQGLKALYLKDSYVQIPNNEKLAIEEDQDLTVCGWFKDNDLNKDDTMLIWINNGRRYSYPTTRLATREAIRCKSSFRCYGKEASECDTDTCRDTYIEQYYEYYDNDNCCYNGNSLTFKKMEGKLETGWNRGGSSPTPTSAIGQCLQDGKRKYGKYGDLSVITTAGGCLQKCSQSSDCAAIVWYKTETKCYFYQEVDGSQLKDEEDWVYATIACLDNLLVKQKSKGLVSTTDWQFICMSMEHQTGISRFYQNGQEITNGSSQYAKMFHYSEKDLYIGAQWNYATNEYGSLTNDIHGSVAFFQIYVGPRLNSEDGTIQAAMDLHKNALTYSNN